MAVPLAPVLIVSEQLDGLGAVTLAVDTRELGELTAHGGSVVAAAGHVSSLSSIILRYLSMLPLASAVSMVAISMLVVWYFRPS